ncbi:MAG: hypothetical protein EOM06_12500, partial [Sphingobacteriia bacterium]|nr:hypothetical protein [Sphingobacteriia bacterium]
MKTTGFVIILVILTCWSTIRPFSQVIPDNNSLQSDKFTLNHYCGGFIQPQGDDQKGVYNGSLNSIGCYYDDHILDLQIYDPEPWDVFYTGNPSHHRSFSDFLNLQAGLLHNALLDDSSNDLFPDKWMDFNKNFQFTSDKIVLDDSLFSREWFDYHPANFPIATDKGWFTARVRTKKESQVTDPCQTYTCGHRFGFTVNLAGGIGPGGNPPAWLTASLASDDAVLLQW